MIKIDVLDAAIAEIEAHPERHDQRYWFYREDGGCGTAACLAGTIALQAGWSPTAWEERYSGNDELSFATARAIKDGEVRDVDDVAMDLLGCERSPEYPDGAITDDEWDTEALFASVNTLEEIKRMRNDIAAKQP